MIFAIATNCSIHLYDTQHKLPFGMITNIHYLRLTDLTWSFDGNFLVVSSADGFCTLIQFSIGELGIVYQEASNDVIINAKTSKEQLNMEIPIDRIIKSSTSFSPEKKPDCLVMPIEVRKCPRKVSE